MGLKEEINDMKKEVKSVKELNKQSLAREMLEDYKKQNKRLFVIIILILTMWFATGCYLVYILNDIGVIEENVETNTKTQEVSDVDSIDNSNIVNGDLNGENKANNEDN